MIPVITQMYFRCTLTFFSFKKNCYKTMCPFSLIKPIIYQFYTNVPSIMLWYKMIKATKKNLPPTCETNTSVNQTNFILLVIVYDIPDNL